jgi:aminoglycoside N3'-acetyltransferase
MNSGSIENEFQKEFEKIIGGGSDVVVIHAALWAFSHGFGRDAKAIPKHILRLMREVAGDRRTLIFPAYSFSFCKSRIFDLTRTASETGILSIAALAEPDAVRTRQPIYSNAVLGPRAAEVIDLAAQTAWGAGSAMEWFARVDTRYVVLGIPWHKSASLIHSSEERLDVPYRYFKRFEGRMLHDGIDIGPARETLFVRSMAVPPDLDYEPATRAIETTSGYRRSGSSSFAMESALASEIQASSDRLVAADPYVFVRNVAATSAWVRDGKAAECAMLAAEERVSEVALTR